MTDFTPLQSLFGGALIGLSAVLLMAFHGRIAGMTGILSGIIPPLAPDWQWRVAFLAGAIVVPILFVLAGGRIAVQRAGVDRRPGPRRRAGRRSASISAMAARAGMAFAALPGCRRARSSRC